MERGLLAAVTGAGFDAVPSATISVGKIESVEFLTRVKTKRVSSIDTRKSFARLCFGLVYPGMDDIKKVLAAFFSSVTCSA